METRTISSRAVTWFVLCSIVAALYLARSFLIPIALAVFVSFVLAPLVRRLTRTGMQRVVATIVTMAGVAVVVAGIGWMLVAQVRGFTDNLAEYRAHMREKAVDIRSTLGTRVEEATTTFRELGNDLSNAGTNPVGPTSVPSVSTDSGIAAHLQRMLGSVIELSAIAALVILLSAVMLFRWDDLRDRMLTLAGESDLASSTHAGKEAAEKVALFLRRQLLVNSMHGTAVGLLLWGIGVPNPLVFGLLAGVLRFVPYVGPIVGTVAPILVSLASSSGWTQTWIAAGGLILLEIVTNNIVEPWFYGGATGVSPLALLVSAAFWTWIWGPAGLVLSTPLTVCLIVVGKHVRSMRFVDVLFGDAPVMSKASRLYHRLLAGDSEEAWEIVRTESAHGSVLETADQVLMPALGFVDAARDDGRLDAEAHQAICTIVQGLVDELADLPREPVVDVPSSAARILCMGARSAFDSMGCRVLVQEYKRRGFDPKLAGAEVLLAEVGEMMRRDEVDLIVVSSVIPTQVLHVRSLCKRLLAVDSRAEILLGLWGEAASKEDLAQRLPSSPRLNVVTTMGATIAWTEAAAPRLVAQRSTRAAC